MISRLIERSAQRHMRTMLAVLAFSALIACGIETRGSILSEVPIIPPAEDPLVDAGCTPCLDASPVSLEGEAVTSRHGGEGGNEFVDTCGANQAVVGFRGTLTNYDDFVFVGRIETVCADLVVSVGSNEVLTGTRTILAAHGRGAGASWAQICPPNQVVSGFRGRAGAALDRIAFECATLRVDGEVFSSDAPSTLEPAGGDGGSEFADACPAGQIARGASLRAGFWVDAFGLVCGTPTR